MRLGGRLAAAIDILTDIETRKRPVADALKDWGLSHRFAGAGDRAAIGNIVYDALRMRLSHGYMMGDDSPSMLAHAVLFRQWGISPEQLAEAVEGDRFAPAALSAEAIGAFGARSLRDAPLHVQADIPEWLEDAFLESFGEDWIGEAQALTARPPLDLRVNTLKTDIGRVGKALARSGAVPAPIARQGLRVPAGSRAERLPNVTAEPAFHKGWFEVQDEGSQIVADLVLAQPGEQVLDFCAGGGGKTLAIAAAMGNKGQVHAYDADRKRLAPIVERLKRAGTRNVQIYDDGTSLDGLKARFDHVVVDAPCTGTGTWRRRPDTKWRLTERNLEERQAQQREVLREAASFVKAGGRLAYVTCSVLPQENGQQIAKFLVDHPEFEPVSAPADWQALFGPDKPLPRTDGNTLTLTPASTGTDGFFFAALQRRNG